MRTRAQLMWQYLNGEASLWEAEKEVGAYLACGCDMADQGSALVATIEDIVHTVGTENNDIAIVQGEDDDAAALATQEGEGEKNEEEASVVAFVPPEQEVEDASASLYWRQSRDGKYSVRSGYWLAIMGVDELGNAAIHEDVWRATWGIEGPHKLRHFLWNACKGNLAVRDRLVYRHIATDATCPICYAPSETIVHSLFECEAAKEIWLHSNLANALVGAPSSSFVDMWLWITRKCNSIVVGECSLQNTALNQKPQVPNLQKSPQPATPPGKMTNPAEAETISAAGGTAQHFLQAQPSFPCPFAEGERVIASHGEFLYKAKVVKVKSEDGWLFYVHYMGWKKRQVSKRLCSQNFNNSDKVSQTAEGVKAGYLYPSKFGAFDAGGKKHKKDSALLCRKRKRKHNMLKVNIERSCRSPFLGLNQKTE
ncbi:hypothetical protein SOVF_054080 [Spinacia oleracea]|nr:hypothetical protein SOVF_054080 [Spinacia oleracea]